MTDVVRRIVNCPNCRKPVPWSNSNRFRPFCSERCRMIDLGTWASDGYRIPAEEVPETPPDEPDED